MRTVALGSPYLTDTARYERAMHGRVVIGGPTGCAQLFDLTADLLKLLTLP